MDRKDEELREVIRKLWPIAAKKNLHTYVPSDEGMIYLSLNPLSMESADLS